MMAPSVSDVSHGILSRTRVFQDLPQGDLDRLCARSNYQRYRRGTSIVRNGDLRDSLIVVGRGRVKVGLTSPAADGELIVGLLRPGSVFGETCVLDHHARTMTAVALVDTEVVFVPRQELLAVIERRPAIALGLLETVCDKLHEAIEMSLAIRFLDVQARFYRCLQHLGRHDARRDDDGVRIHHALSQRELADSIGVSREALNKLFGEWRRAGLVVYGRGYVIVKDPAALALRLPPALRASGLIEPCVDGHDDGAFAIERRRRDPRH
jgi:CRP-like cAMP-binding protein